MSKIKLLEIDAIQSQIECLTVRLSDIARSMNAAVSDGVVASIDLGERWAVTERRNGILEDAVYQLHNCTTMAQVREILANLPPTLSPPVIEYPQRKE